MSDLNQDQSRIIERIKKLLALAGNNPNEEEALLASAKVQELLAEYNLSMSDVRGSNNRSDVIRDSDLLTDYSGWVKPLMTSIAKLYFCGYFYESFPSDWIQKNNLHQGSRKLFAGGHSRTYLRHNFIGEGHNIIVCKNVGEYLISAMERQYKKAVKNIPSNQKSSFQFSFFNACAARLCVRLLERKMTTSTTASGNLPALRPLYDQAEEMFEEWKKNTEGLNLKDKKALIKIHNEAGARAGIKAGNEIGLDHQIDSSKNSSQLEAR